MQFLVFHHTCKKFAECAQGLLRCAGNASSTLDPQARADLLTPARDAAIAMKNLVGYIKFARF